MRGAPERCTGCHAQWRGRFFNFTFVPMSSIESSPALPPIPAKRYFTIGEVSELCAVKPHVLRYWEQEFTQLKPIKRRGNRRYYQHHEVLLIRRIRHLLYEQGFTISGARNRLGDNRDAPYDQDAAIRLSAQELQALRNELVAARQVLAEALGEPAARV